MRDARKTTELKQKKLMRLRASLQFWIIKLDLNLTAADLKILILNRSIEIIGLLNENRPSVF